MSKTYFINDKTDNLYQFHKQHKRVQTFIDQTVQSINLLMFQIDLALGSVRTQPSLNEFEIDVTLVSLTSDKTKLIEFLDCFPCESINQTWNQLSYIFNNLEKYSEGHQDCKITSFFII